MDVSVALFDCTPEEARAAVDAITEVMAPTGARLEYLLVGPDAVDSEGLRGVVSASDGYGDLLRAARDAARGRRLLTLDAPSPYDASLVFTFWHRRETADLLVASRYAKGGSYRMPFLRVCVSRMLNALYRSGLSMPVHDLSSARRMYRCDLLRRVELEGADFDVLMEAILTFMSKGGRVGEVPWHYESRYYRQQAGTTARLVRSCLSTFWRMHALRNSVDFVDYDHRAYDSRIWFQRYWQRKRFRIIREFEGAHPGRALDAGCGSSRIITTRPEMYAMDINFNRLLFLRPSNPRRFQATAGCLPFGDGVFDTVISSQVIEHTPEKTCISECVRVLRPGGTLIIGTPDYGRPWWPITEKIYGWVKRGGYADEHITHYTYPSLTGEIEESGCRVLGHRYICGGELIVKAVKAEG
jgi:SAM-dependent methyltransferase